MLFRNKIIGVFIAICLIGLISEAQFFNLSNSYFKADKVYYNNEEKFVEATGNVQIYKDNYLLKSDRVIYDIENDYLITDGRVYIHSGKEKLSADNLVLDNKNNTGSFYNSKILLNDEDVITASKASKINDDVVILENAKFSPCKACIKDEPIWQIESEKTKINFTNQLMTYRNASFKIFGYKVMQTPYFAHPMPKAKARSGILFPEVSNGMFKIPFYLRASDNLDFTYSPKFNHKDMLNEIEMRHLTNYGQYRVFTSFNKSNVKIRDNNKVIQKDEKEDRYYIQSNGKFNIMERNIGYNFEHVSDKSYLKNFYLDNRDYLHSKLYHSSFYTDGYNHFDVQKFQGLRTIDSKNTDPTILPNFRIKKDYLSDSGWNYTINENLTNYTEYNEKKIIRNSLNFDLNKNYYGNSGQILTYGLSNRFDLYKLDKLRETKAHRDTLIRNIPEIYSIVRMPKLFSINDSTIIVEPKISAFLGKDKSPNIFDKHLIDSPNIEISEMNLFNSSRFSGIDYHEYGKRLNYGLNTNFMNNHNNFSAFFGQALTSSDSGEDRKSNFIGRVGYNYADNFEIYYKFKKRNPDFKPFRDEVVLWANIYKFSFYNNLSILRNLNNQSDFYYQAVKIKQNNIKQNYTNITYNISKNMKAFAGTRFNIKKNSKFDFISSDIGLSYRYDCISIYTGLSNDFTHDLTKGVKKNRSFTLKLGMKSINL